MVRWLVLSSALLAACAAPADEAEDKTEDETAEAAWNRAAGPSDPAATAETRVVMANLQSFSMASSNPFDRRVLVGQQEADVSNRTANGLAPIASDVETVTGRGPG